MAMDGRYQKKLAFVLFSILLLFSSCRYRPHQRQRGADDRRYDRIEQRYQDRTSKRKKLSGPVYVPLERGNGVFYVRIKVNDVPMRFVFDTGASVISLSLTEANFLVKQGTLTESDFDGEEFFSDAVGNINMSYKVNLRTIEIGGVTLHNVPASVVPNQDASLLLGQSALSQFDKVSVDYKQNMLILE